MSRPLVKVCGLTRVDDARRAAAAGVDLLGLNFYPPSPRAVGVEQARELAAAIRAARPEGRGRIVGLFVDAPREAIEAADRAVGFDLLQFHGDEAPEELAPWGGRAIKVFRVRPEVVESLPLGLYPEAWGFLFDIHHSTLYGGTGTAWHYAALAGLRGDRRLRGRPYLVAGGIRPETARDALAASGADGVDLCSGVESAPGIKDPQRLEQLMREIAHHDSIAS